MNTKEIIKLTVPEIKGFEYTGEYRMVERDEYYANRDYEVSCNDDWASFVIGNQLILKKVYEEPKEPTLLERIEEKWPDKKVVMLEWSSIDFLSLPSKKGTVTHALAQSMKGFAGYVYIDRNSYFDMRLSPVRGEDPKLPIAVLFNK